MDEWMRDENLHLCGGAVISMDEIYIIEQKQKTSIQTIITQFLCLFAVIFMSRNKTNIYIST